MIFYYIKSNNIDQYRHWVKYFNSIGYDWSLSGIHGSEFIINNGDCYLCISDGYDGNWKSISHTQHLNEGLEFEPLLKHPIYGRKLKLERILQ